MAGEVLRLRSWWAVVRCRKDWRDEMRLAVVVGARGAQAQVFALWLHLPPAALARPSGEDGSLVDAAMDHHTEQNGLPLRLCTTLHAAQGGSKSHAASSHQASMLCNAIATARRRLATSRQPRAIAFEAELYLT